MNDYREALEHLDKVMHDLDGLPEYLKRLGLKVDSLIVGSCEAILDATYARIEQKQLDKLPITIEQHKESEWEADNER